MNWGNKLVFVFIAFATLIGTLVYKAMHTKYELVSQDYYKDELRYQDKIDGKINAAKISKIRISQDAEAVEIHLPVEMQGHSIKGEAWFYCKTDAVNDRRIPLEMDASGTQLVMKNKLAKGNYELKLNWETGSEKYYSEEKLTVN
jgi:hypothetical protein